MDRHDPRFVAVNEPFNEGRGAARLVFDFGAMLSCFLSPPPNPRVLDFCAGSGWISEWLNRLGYQVWAIDLNAHAEQVLRSRCDADSRLDSSGLTFVAGDAHTLPFADGLFGHVCSFDSLHHMRDYRRTLAEMNRVLAPGGRAVFIEPGARHSTSAETVAFIREFKSDDPDWIERDVVIEEVDALAREAGFSGIVLRPMLPAGHREYRLAEWQRFRSGDPQLACDFVDQLKCINYDSRLVFYLQKP